MAQVIRFPRSLGARTLAPPPLDDFDLVPIALLLTAASFARVALAVAHHEVFGAEATLAFIASIVLPVFIARRARRAWQAFRHVPSAAPAGARTPRREASGPRALSRVCAEAPRSPRE